MITRGIIIGEIIDDLSNLKGQIEFRCGLGLTDLNKYCEDFFCETLNLIYNLKLKNLNSSRSNEPALDLGDKKNKIAYQITSTADSSKVNNTLAKITKEQSKDYSNFKVFVIGKKQGSYTSLDTTLTQKHSFSTQDIVDLTDMSKDLIALSYDKVHSLYLLFQKEFQKVITELEIPNKDGKYPTTISDKVEVIPTTKASNGKEILKTENDLTLDNITNCFEELSTVPRITREFLKVVIELGEMEDENYYIHYHELTRKLQLNEKTILEEISILERKGLLFEPDESETSPRVCTRFSFELFLIVHYAIEEKILNRLIVSLDFTVLDE